MPKAQATGLFVNLDSDYKENQPDLRVQIDRARAADLGVSIEDIGRTLELMFGERQISTFVNRGEEYYVIIRARAAGPGDAERSDQHLHARDERRSRSALVLRDADRDPPRRRP